LIIARQRACDCITSSIMYAFAEKSSKPNVSKLQALRVESSGALSEIDDIYY